LWVRQQSAYIPQIKRQAHKKLPQDRPQVFLANSMRKPVPIKNLGDWLANGRLANLKARLNTPRLAWLSFKLTLATVFGCQKAKKHLIGKQPPEVA
jgi:hypothetical protein